MSVDQLEAVRENEDEVVETNEYQTASECAKQTGLKSKKIVELCNDGEIKCYQLKSRRWMVDINSLQNYILDHKH